MIGFSSQSFFSLFFNLLSTLFVFCRFDTFELSILDDETGALANLTSKIGKDIDQVWRQIGIMHQQMSMSTDTLNKLQNQTDAYVNGTFDVMDNMKGKVKPYNRFNMLFFLIWIYTVY